MKFWILILVLGISTSFASAGLLDLFDWSGKDDEVPAENRNNNARENNQTTCDCVGASCKCCVDFNMTLIDLGGPGCVQMKYLSQDEGVLMNVSYGHKVLHSKQVKGPNPEPTCMVIISDLAQICARFSDLKPYESNGLKGCLLLEPKLLGDIAMSFNTGCFLMNPNQMRVEKRTNSSLSLIDLAGATLNNGNTNDTEINESGNLNEDELFAAVSETAEKGLTYFGSLLGITFSDLEINSTNSDNKNNDNQIQPVKQDNQPNV